MKKLSVILFILAFASPCFSQQAFYDVTQVDGNGIRFWLSDWYKIHMGNTSEYHYGPVTDYSIKTNMNPTAGRGWTWGIMSATPVAALSNTGSMQIAGNFNVGGDIVLPSVSGNKQIYTWNQGDVGWRIGMSASPGFTRSLATSHVQYLTYSSGAGQGFAIGTNGGQSSFEVLGSDNTAFFRGNVGIGTTAPVAKLEVVGPATGSGAAIRASGGGDVLMNSGGSLFFDGNYSYASGNYIRPLASNTQAFFTSGSERLRITATGNVGIGTTSPNQMLTVNGTIYGKEVKVDLSVPGPDYVFEENYKLPSLEEIKTYIDQHKHLPEVPSAKEMEANGINVGEMNMILLKKVEELTLLMIELKNENTELKKENEKQNTILSHLLEKNN